MVSACQKPVRLFHGFIQLGIGLERLVQGIQKTARLFRRKNNCRVRSQHRIRLSQHGMPHKHG